MSFLKYNNPKGFVNKADKIGKKAKNKLITIYILSQNLLK